MSQPKRRRTSTGGDDDVSQISLRPKPADKLSATEQEALLAQFIRYTLFMHTSQRPIKREEYRQHVFAKYGGKSIFDEILIQARRFFKDTFGYTLVSHPYTPVRRTGGSTAPKPTDIYLLVMDKVGSDEDTWRHMDSLPHTDVQLCDYGLLMTILGIVHYNGGTIAMDILWYHLGKLGLTQADPKNEFSQPVQDLLETFVKQRYLEKVKEEARPEDDKPLYVIKKGIRAIHELPDDIHLHFKSNLWDKSPIISVDDDGHAPHNGNEASSSSSSSSGT